MTKAVKPISAERSVAGRAARRHAVVVGAGLAGLHVAQALALRDWRVTVLDATSMSNGVHALHLAAALTPMVSRGDDLHARLSRAGSLSAQARWAQIPESIVARCGALQLQRTSGRIVDLKRIVDELAFAPEWVRFVDVEQASALAGMKLSRGGLYFSQALRVRPQPLLELLAATPGLTRLIACAQRVEQRGGQWCVLDAERQVLADAEQVILAAGLATQHLLSASGLLVAGSRLAAMYSLGGEVTYVERQLLGGGPRCIVAGDGYVLPAVEGKCVVGSSYLQGVNPVTTTTAGRQENLVRAAGLLNHPLKISNSELLSLKGWVGQRAVVPDRLPVIGPLANSPGLWVATGFASRGLTWASLAGDLIAAALHSEPSPLENDIMSVIGQN